MSLTHPNLKLDEQSFQALLAAAFTVQEHNEAQKRASGQNVCSVCGNLLASTDQFCGQCGTRRDQLRPGELMQRKWASLWMMSQNRGARLDTPERLDSAEEQGSPAAQSFPPESPNPNVGYADYLEFEQNVSPRQETLPAEEESVAANDELAATEMRRIEFYEEPQFEHPERDAHEYSRLPLILRFRREDLYLSIAVLISVFSILWVIWAGPVTRGWHEGPRLTVWQRTLVKLGIAEATPRTSPVFRGDPSAKVWTDPHTALYYCYGAEQFGKTPDGHFSTQREAQLDRFSPAARTPCE